MDAALRLKNIVESLDGVSLSEPDPVDETFFADCQIKLSLTETNTSSEETPENGTKYGMFKPKEFKIAHKQFCAEASKRPQTMVGRYLPELLERPGFKEDREFPIGPIAYKSSVQKVVDWVEERACGKCGSSGSVTIQKSEPDYFSCQTCNGSGMVTKSVLNNAENYNSVLASCSSCLGRGNVATGSRSVSQVVKCTGCGGSGSSSITHYKKQLVHNSIQNALKIVSRGSYKPPKLIRKLAQKTKASLLSGNQIANLGDCEVISIKERRNKLLIRYQLTLPVRRYVILEDKKRIGEVYVIQFEEAGFLGSMKPFLDKHLKRKCSELKKVKGAEFQLN
jgi:hypothetical protein